MASRINKLESSIFSKWGFELCSNEAIDEIEGVAYVCKHTLSGARFLYLQNADKNRSFSIAFKTPPTNSTGVFHILEHSVLCGSERYPLKEPFVNLLKASAQTFLNAMTYPDKTVYPVASTSEKDLENLMRVYLDAVFNPNIYLNERIFEQEGWHKEVADDGSIDYSGVVYSEMKGALSDPTSMLFDTICSNLYPNSPYEFESGGEPKEIPNLSYESFLNEHKKHYRPSNSYIILYGDLQIERFLKVISEVYLKPAYKKLEESFSDFKPNELKFATQSLTEVKIKKMEISEDSTCAALAFRFENACDLKTLQAIELIFDALMCSNVSQLKKRLLSAGIADEFFSEMIEPVQQPALMIVAQGIKSEESLSKMEEIVMQTLREWAEGDLDVKEIEASINHAELVMREHNFGMADGVVYSLDCLSTWLYDEDKPYSCLKFESIFKRVRKMLEDGQFQKIIKELFLNNKNVARAQVLSGEEGRQEPQFVSENEKQKIDNEVAELRKEQQKEDSKEAIEMLPHLTRDDIGLYAPNGESEIVDIDGVCALEHTLQMNSGLHYYNVYFNIDFIDFNKLPYLSLLASFLGKFDAGELTAEEIVLKSRSLFGIFNFSIPTYTDKKTGNAMLKLRIKTSLLPGNELKASSLISTILKKSNFNNPEKVSILLLQIKQSLEQNIINSGHSFAMKRASASFSAEAKINEELSGITFYQFIKEKCDDLANSVEEIIVELEALKRAIFCRDNMFLGFVGTKQSASQFLSSFNFDASNTKISDLKIPTSPVKPLAFATKSEVTFTALANNFSNIASTEANFGGRWLIAAKALSYDYLWNKVRVQGGAYGCGFLAKRLGDASFYTFRDPNVKSSVEAIQNAYRWLSSFNPSERDMDGFVISTVAGIDDPIKTSEVMLRAECDYFEGFESSFRREIRDELLDCSKQDILQLSEAVGEIAESGSIVCIGNKEIINRANMFDEVIEL